MATPVGRRDLGPGPDPGREPPAAAQPPGKESTALQTAVQVLGSVAGPLTLLTALLFYFSSSRSPAAL